MLSSASIYSQPGNSFVAIRTGLSLPMGNYSSNTLPDGSYTTAGLNLGASGAWYFSDHFGIAGYFGYDIHPVNTGALADDKIAQDPFIDSLVIRSEPFRLYTLAAGVSYHKSFSQDFSLSPKILAGIQYGITPYQLYKAEYFMIGKNWYEITSAKDAGFTAIAGIDADYEFNPYIGLFADLSISYSHLEFGFSKSDGTVRIENKDVVLFIAAAGIKIFL